MRQIKVGDRYSHLSMRMCEKHFKIYKRHLKDAHRGGSWYTSQKTSERGCELCKKEKEG